MKTTEQSARSQPLFASRDLRSARDPGHALLVRGGRDKKPLDLFVVKPHVRNLKT